MADGRCGLDRAAVLVKLHTADVNEDQLGDATATGFSLGRLYGLLDRVRSFTADDERTGFEHRYLVIQPSLDDAAYKLWGLLPGVDGQIISAALDRRENELPVLPGEGNGQGQRRADALTALCLDTLTAHTGSDPDNGDQGRAVTVAEVFVDAGLAAGDGGETGATLPSGVKAGPNTLAEILCGGKVRVIAVDGLHPVAYTDRTDVIPPAVRRFVQWRDIGHCSIEGCHSRYRIQPHHILERHRGGTTTRRTWSACAGTTTTSPSTNSATPSTRSHPSIAGDSSPPANPPGHPSATPSPETNDSPPPPPHSRSRAKAADPGAQARFDRVISPAGKWVAHPMRSPCDRSTVAETSVGGRDDRDRVPTTDFRSAGCGPGGCDRLLGATSRDLDDARPRDIPSP